MFVKFRLFILLVFTVFYGSLLEFVELCDMTNANLLLNIC